MVSSMKHNCQEEPCAWTRDRKPTPVNTCRRCRDAVRLTIISVDTTGGTLIVRNVHATVENSITAVLKTTNVVLF